MFSVPTIIDIARFALPLAVEDVAKGALFGKRLDTSLPLKIAIYTKSVRWAYNQNPNYPRLQELANFLYAICGKYGMLAQTKLGEGRFINDEGNTQISNADTAFPFRLTSASFNGNATQCNDARVIGKNIYLELIENGTTESRYLQATAGFTYTTTGFKISTGGSATIPDFSSLTTDWIIIVHKLN